MGILDAMGSIDWIGPAISVLGNLAHGPHHTFTFPACEMTPRDIELMLRKRGVGTWGLLHVDGTTMLSVRKQDAARAYGILKAANVPVENPPPQQATQRKRERGSPFSVFDEVFKK
jgi:hypothetical protein